MFRSAASRAVGATRRFATASPAAGKSSNAPLYLMGAGIAGLGAYIYLFRGDALAPKQEHSPLDPENFKEFKLKKILPYNHNSSRFVFELPNNEASLLPVASMLLVKATDPEALKDKKGNPVIRPYTPISPSDHKGELVFLIKKYDTGNMSKHIHELKEGDTLMLKGPNIKFPYKANEFDEIALIGGGSGITPLYQIANHALANPENKTKFKLIYANVSSKDILLRETLDDLKKKYPTTFDVVYVVDKADANWDGATGYVTSDLIKQHVAPPTLQDKVKIFICGPPPQVISIAGKKAGMKQGELGGILKELGYTEDQVFKY